LKFCDSTVVGATPAAAVIVTPVASQIVETVGVSAGANGGLLMKIVFFEAQPPAV
jgi:hypothetical protein